VITPGNHAFNFNEIEGDPLYYSRVLLKIMAASATGTVTATAITRWTPAVSVQPSTPTAAIT